MLYKEVLDRKTYSLLNNLQSIPELSKTRLVGGTALALQCGHRVSVDLDLFGEFDSSLPLEMFISQCGNCVIKTGSNRLMQFFEIDGIKVDFVNYSYPWLKPTVIEEEIKLASIEDIAAMKVNAIINRGSKKDFVDLYQLLSIFSLGEIFSFFSQKYNTGNIQTALRSMTYFVDAELETLPKMLCPFDWNIAKNKIKESVRQFESKE